MQAGGNHAGGALLEIARGQLEQVVEHGGAQHRIDAVAGVQDEVLAHPAEQGGEHHEHGQADADDDEGALRAVHHDLVDDHLGEQRRAQRQQLDDERGDQHVAPDALVLHQLGDKPSEAELGLFVHRAIRVFDALGFERQLEGRAGIAHGEFRVGHASWGCWCRPQTGPRSRVVCTTMAG